MAINRFKDINKRTVAGEAKLARFGNIFVQIDQTIHSIIQVVGSGLPRERYLLGFRNKSLRRRKTLRDGLSFPGASSIMLRLAHVRWRTLFA